MKTTYLFSAVLLPFLYDLTNQKVAAQMPVTVVNTAFTQNFNSLPSAGSALSQTGTVFAEGWMFQEGDTNGDGLYRTGDGSGTTGDTYSMGSTASSSAAAVVGLSPPS